MLIYFGGCELPVSGYYARSAMHLHLKIKSPQFILEIMRSIGAVDMEFSNTKRIPNIGQIY